MSVSTLPISVIIPAYLKEASLTQTIAKICACDPLPAEILIHLDGGWNPDTDFTKNSPVPIRVLRSHSRLGPGGGRHRMLLEAGHEIVCSFDDDSWPLDSDYFAKAGVLMEALPDAAVISPSVFLAEKPVAPVTPLAHTARNFQGSASIHHRSRYLQLPGYVPVPDAYGMEEADLSLQIHAAGFAIYDSPWIRAWHDRPRSDKWHTTLPWIRNEILLAYLRFPCITQPLGWIRSLRHAWRSRKTVPLGILLKALLFSLPLCASFKNHRHRVSIRQLMSHVQHRPRATRIETAYSAPNLPVITLHSMGPPPRVLSIQYSNPGAYPPVEHMSKILARRGWEIECLGIEGFRGVNLEMTDHDRVRVWRLKNCQPGRWMMFHYARFSLLCFWRAWVWRPDWLYLSDPLSAPIGRLLARLFKVRTIYHEHDSPSQDSKELRGVKHAIMQNRLRLSQGCDLLVLPNQTRLEALLKVSGRSGPALCVWNCPSLEEIPARGPHPDARGVLRLVYHGSIVPERFPKTMIEALRFSDPNISLWLIGYEVQGSIGYPAELLDYAAALGVSDRFDYLGSLPNRADLLARCSDCDVGLSLLAVDSADINLRHMCGASNKVFDYLSQGLAVIVPDDPEWRRMFVETGCGVVGALHDARSLAEVWNDLCHRREDLHRMGKNGRELTLTKWNYENQFAPVIEEMLKAECRAGRSF